jgi:serine/threonine protein kinase
MKYAIKSVPMAMVKKTYENFESEISVSIGCDHQNLCNFFELYKDEKYLHLVMEHVYGGDVCDKLMGVPGNRFSEEVSKKIIYDALKGLNYLH